MPLPRIAIATGDPAGIGPEIALKAAINANVRALCRPLLVGDPAVVELHARAAGLSPNLRVVENAADA
ncbi:MAG: 4-hydroxythreonine-4-phosphate dehydrogenase, partial [Pseudolabrys sp.]